MSTFTHITGVATTFTSVVIYQAPALTRDDLDYLSNVNEFALNELMGNEIICIRDTAALSTAIVGAVTDFTNIQQE